LSEVIITTNRSNYYILGEIGRGTREQIQHNIQINFIQFCHNIKQMLMP